MTFTIDPHTLRTIITYFLVVGVNLAAWRGLTWRFWAMMPFLGALQAIAVNGWWF